MLRLMGEPSRHRHPGGYFPLMRTALAVMMLIATTTAGHAEMSPAECRTYLTSLDELRRASVESQEAFGELNLVEMMSGGSTAVRDASKPVDAARIKLVAALREYVALSAELERHLRNCVQ
ncbi:MULTISPECIES: hypothetical protein [unclassified Methylobacterium]|uniref:hypothetical protein n=1 Tax=unclassified Methylobacterium TaxID=2615210 RepID=UPI0011C71DC4|nr:MULTISPECIES: hypothetical protein [unclassified Methylobacterium]TXM94829.1 hypothetical protein FV223_03270 [Methylobacterium sp. WL116]TXN71476.1 hypothetical protein FV230_08435 [Methylobacterium sp. WL6]